MLQIMLYCEEKSCPEFACR